MITQNHDNHVTLCVSQTRAPLCYRPDGRIKKSCAKMHFICIEKVLRCLKRKGHKDKDICKAAYEVLLKVVYSVSWRQLRGRNQEKEFIRHQTYTCWLFLPVTAGCQKAQSGHRLYFVLGLHDLNRFVCLMLPSCSSMPPVSLQYLWRQQSD